MKKVKLNKDQERDTLTIAERMELLEAENAQLRSEIEGLRKRQDEAQEASYLIECDLHSEQEKILHLEATSVLSKYASKAELKSLKDDLLSVKRIAIKSREIIDNWVAMMQKIKGEG